MTPALDWLDARTADAPEALRACMRAYVERVDEHDVARALASAGIAALHAALPRAEQRDGALDLLAADALLTHALEAAAEQGSGQVETLSEELVRRRIPALLAAGAGS